MTCELAHLDGAYVLGALSPSERLDYERHLLTCAECSRSVRELAGIPGLLAQVDPADLEAAPHPPVPETLLPALVREARGDQRRRSFLVAGVAAGLTAAAVASIAVIGGLTGEREPVAGPTPSTSVSRSAVSEPMAEVGPTPVEASLLVASVAWGTRLDLTCSYADAAEEDEYEASPAAQYALVVRTRDGQSQEVATWHGLPGRTMHLTGATATRRPDMEAVEVRTADGIVVLRLTV
jgi:Putative zinc-finger